jgi:hypothetical protein
MATQDTPDRPDRLTVSAGRKGAKALTFLIAQSVLIKSSCPAEVSGIHEFSLSKSKTWMAGPSPAEAVDASPGFIRLRPA